jgi:hypothetical protein
MQARQSGVGQAARLGRSDVRRLRFAFCHKGPDQFHGSNTTTVGRSDGSDPLQPRVEGSSTSYRGGRLVLVQDSPAELWVAEANPRARRFYEKHGFISDGARFIDELEIAEIRMVRGC